MEYILSRSQRQDKKFVVKIKNKKTGKIEKQINFGAKGYSDYTIHKDKDRRDRYDNRHHKRENWKKSGVQTAGFWAKWILWNKKTINDSIKDTEKRFGIKIIRQ